MVVPPPSIFELACAGDTEAIRAMYPVKPLKGVDEPPDPNGRDDRGRTALDLAVIWGFVETAEVSARVPVPKPRRRVCIREHARAKRIRERRAVVVYCTGIVGMSNTPYNAQCTMTNNGCRG